MESSGNKARVNKIKECYTGRNFSFTVENVTLPNGYAAEYGIVRHPGSTGIVPVLNDGRVVMVRQYRHAVGEYMLEVPAGTLERGEAPLKCAMRELEEETGFTAKEMVKVGAVHILPSYTDEVIHVFLARGLEATAQHLDGDEVLQVVSYPFDQLMEFVRDGKITDALTILSLHRAEVFLKNA
ncbi:MAG: NUDIX hydrolase [Syntrophobacteraceae bacterium]|nr:NUDIX hydrolase [Desulfobacteraceae bacterium]